MTDTPWFYSPEHPHFIESIPLGEDGEDVSVEIAAGFEIINEDEEPLATISLSLDYTDRPHADLNAEQARQIARALNAAADTIDSRDS